MHKELFYNDPSMYSNLFSGQHGPLSIIMGYDGYLFQTVTTFLPFYIPRKYGINKLEVSPAHNISHINIIFYQTQIFYQ